MIKVGLTGGIGSGKTTVARILKQLGIDVYDSDKRGKWFLEHDPQVRESVIEIFGENAYKNDVPDRGYIAQRVFSDSEKLKQLNAIIHPAVRADFGKWCEAHNDDRMVVAESAILIESDMYKDMDRIIVVTAPENIRIERTVSRDNTNVEAVRARIAAQLDENRRLSYADYIITADEKTPIVPQILRIIEDIF